MPDPKAAPLPEPPATFREFTEAYPAVVQAYDHLGAAVREAGPLSPRDVALVKLAMSIGARMEGSVHAHTRKAVAQGIDAAELEHVAVLACPTLGFPNMMTAVGWVRDVTRGG